MSAAHFVSHYYILLLAPLFAFVRAEYNVSYTELALALAVFNLVSGALQTPAGFLVDLISARLMLIGGLVLGSLAFVVVGLVDSYWVLVAMFAVAGLANTVYHPADYAILSNQVSPQRMAQAYSIHTFAGFVGTAVAPVCALLLERFVGWRGAFIASAALGLFAAAFLAAQRDAPVARSPAAQAASSDSATDETWRLLLSGPILRNFAFFTLLSLMNAAIYYYTAVALGALYGTPAALANAALTTFSCSRRSACWRAATSARARSGTISSSSSAWSRPGSPACSSAWSTCLRSCCSWRWPSAASATASSCRRAT